MSRKVNLLLILFGAIMFFSFGSAHGAVKNPNVSGRFYPGNAQELQNQVQEFFANVPENQFQNKRVDILIAPHAGYVFSGDVAARGFKRLNHQEVKTVVILAPSHYFQFQGVSVWEKGAFKTPLGEVKVNHQLAKKILNKSSLATYDPKVFEKEHSLEVMLPFLQSLEEDKIDIVPIVMGQPSFEEMKKFARILFEVIGEREDVVVVVSTDMSHFHDAETAKEMDTRALEHIRKFNFDRLWNDFVHKRVEFCGFVPVMTGMFLANYYGLNALQVLDYKHSGEVNGDNSRVVGYTSIAMSLNKDLNKRRLFPLNGKQRSDLLTIARETIDHALRNEQFDFSTFDDVRLRENEGAFISLYKGDDLRGCMGRIISNQHLTQTVHDTALLAAFDDPRFPKLTEEEWPEIELEVSVLSIPRKVQSADEIKLGKHGVIISKGNKRGVFLPQVATDTRWSKEKFLSELASQKAGLSPDAWKDPTVTLEVFTAQVFKENEIEE